MHKQGLIHRDIKPENILIKEGNIVKICDFGWCVQTDASSPRSTFCGTLEYMAPEMINNTPHNHTLDIWALGILLYELVHGRAPFTGAQPREIGDKIRRGAVRFKPSCTDEFKDLVLALLQATPADRIPLIKVFDHPWVKAFEKKYNLSRTPPPAAVKGTDNKKAAAAAAAAEALKQRSAEEKARKKALAEEAARQEAERKEATRREKLLRLQKEKEKREGLLLQKQK